MEGPSRLRTLAILTILTATSAYHRQALLLLMDSREEKVSRQHCLYFSRDNIEALYGNQSKAFLRFNGAEIDILCQELQV